MTKEHSIEQRIQALEIENAKIKTRLEKKHEELDNIHQDLSKFDDNIKDLLTAISELTNIQKYINEDVKENQKEIDNLKTQVILHSATFESYKEKQKGIYASIGVAVSIIAIVVPVLMRILL